MSMRDKSYVRLKEDTAVLRKHSHFEKVNHCIPALFSFSLVTS